MIRYVVARDHIPNWMYCILDREEGRLVISEKPPGWLRFRSENSAQKRADKMNKGAELKEMMS